MSVARWWIVVTVGGSPAGVFTPDERGFAEARKFAASNATDDRPAVLYPAHGSFEIAPYAIQQQVTLVAPAIEVKP